ncbi:prop effector ProQ [Rubrivivax gelatinosus]|nr:ProQ/FinO family protein [Rubrivivax gelatinosus]MBK1612595.1 prop effector ProQ [Rubrivivax gelatinosus]
MPDDDQIPPESGAEPANLPSAAPAADAAPEVATEPVAQPEGEAVPEAEAEADASAPAEAAGAKAVPELSPAECAARLAELFPALFGAAPKPLKLRIQADIQQRAPGIFTRRTLSVFLHRHTTSNAYLSALTRSEQRFDLDGQPAGELSAEHRELATAELARRRGVHEQRRAAERAAARAAEAQSREQQNAEHEARRERAGLLRAFETTTLTRANFCALKGIADAELDAVLERARQERAERPAMPPRDAHPGRPDNRPERRGQRPQGHDRRPGGPRPEGGERPDRGPRPQGERRAEGAPADGAPRPKGPRPERGPRPEGQGRPPKR